MATVTANLGGTQNRAWAEDKSSFGYKMLMKMGWSDGKGLGKNEDGNATHIRIQKREEAVGIGAEGDGVGNGILSNSLFTYNQLLKTLNSEHRSSATPTASADASDSEVSSSPSDSSDSKKKKSKKSKDKKRKSKKSKKSEKSEKSAIKRSRITYNKFLRAKKVKGYSAEDLRSILGVAPPPQAQPGIKLFGVDYPEEEEQAAKRQRIEEEDAGPRTSTTKEVYVHGDVETQKVEKAKKDKKAKKEKKKEKKGK